MNGGDYSLSQCDMISLLAANVKCVNTGVKKMIKVLSMHHTISPFIDMMMMMMIVILHQSKLWTRFLIQVSSNMCPNF